MPTTDQLQFEMQRRVILFNSGTTMPDNTVLGYEGNPNSANTSTPGQTLLYNSPRGTSYIELVNGNLWYKQQIPNTWINLTSGTQSGTAGTSSQNNVVFVTGNQTISGTKTFDVFPIVSGNRLITGLDLNSYATTINLFNTGSILDNKINSLSGSLSGTLTGNYVTKFNGQFTNTPTVNGTPVLLSGQADVLLADVVYTTGNQTINGVKTFAGSSDSVNDPIVIIKSDGNQAPYTFRINDINQAYVKGDGQGNLAFGAQNFIAFEAGGFGAEAEKMRVQADGKVGIGTNEPSEKLEVVGNIIANNLVYNTSDQNIDGTKNFYKTPTINGDGILSSGQDIIGGDLTGDLLSATINKLQGYPLSINSPSAGQTLIYNGETWVPGANAGGGGGGGGLFYYFNFENYNGIAPSGGLPTTGYSALSLLGRQYGAGAGEFTSPNLTPQNQYHLVTHFVSASGDPGVTNIPAGLWDFNIWAKTDSTIATQTQMKAVVNIYNPTNSTYRYVNQSDDVYLYDTTTPAQYILNVTMPQTGIQDYERIYVQLFGKKTTNPAKTITFYFDSYRPSHVHTTIPSIAGSGVVKIINGIYQTPASTIVDVDVSATANIQQSKIQNLTTDLADLNNKFSLLSGNLITTGSILDQKINSLSGWSASASDLANTGLVLNNKINSLSGYVNSQDIIFSGQTASTGSILDNKINILSGYTNSQNIILSGQIASSGSNLYNSILSLSGLFTGYTGSLDANFATDAQLFTTGSILDNKINALSGYVSGISAGASLPATIVYTTGNQTISGTKTFIENTIFGDSSQGDFLVISGNTFTIYGSGNFTNGLFISGVPVLTGVDLSSYATSANLFITGSTLDNKINSLSGYVNSQDNIFSGQTFNTGSRLDNKINALSGYVTGITGTFGTLPANLTLTGSILNDKINSLSGYVNVQDNIFSGQTFNTGSRLDNKINSLSGYVDSKDITFSGQIASTGSSLYNSILSLSGLFTGYTGSLDANFASDAQLFATGSSLDNKINSLSGYVNSQDVIFSGQTALTGSILDNKINSLSGYVDSKSITLPSTIVYTTGDQTISGVKTFDSYINLNSDLYGHDIYANIVQLNNIRDQFDENTNIYLTDNKITLIPFSSYVGVTGNLEVSNNVYAKNLVYTTSNQTISGIKTFTSRPTVNGTGVLLIGEASPIALPTTIVYTTGDQIISGNKTFINNIAVSGTGDFNSVKVSNIDKLFLSGIDILITGNSSINVYNPVYISGNPVLTGVDLSSYALISNLFSTGSVLDNKINSLSGYVNSRDSLFSGQTAFTGSILDNKINALSGYVSGISLGGLLPSTIVYTTGNQLISGNKTFLNNLNISGTGNFNNVRVSSIDKLFLSGIDMVVTGNSSINVYNAIYISGNPVLTGVIPTTQTITNVVYTTGNQTISGTKIFASPIVFSSGIDGIYLGGAGGSIDLRGGDTDGYSPGGAGGNIIMRGASPIYNGNGKAGDINTSASIDAGGGNINTAGGYEGSAGGNIYTNGGAGYYMPGGSINTSNGGGNIYTFGNTRNNVSALGGNIYLSGKIDVNGNDNIKNGGSINLSAGGGNIESIGGSDYSWYDGDNTYYQIGGQGGSINLNGGNAEEGVDGANGGSINTSSNAGFLGGSINTSASPNSNGGSINTYGGPQGNGGQIDVSNNGGSIITRAGSDGISFVGGGSINTSAGGGSIDTRGQGQIQFGNNNQRTTLSGTASTNRTIYLPDANGTLALDSNVATTGSVLNDKINSLSGYVNTQDIIFSGQIASSGSRLDNKINALSGYVSGISAGGLLPNSIVYITGNQTISGTKTFANNLEVQGTGIFNALDLSNISEFNFSGTNINLINGNVNISGGALYISGNPVLTGVNLNAYATTANLYATGSTLDNKINALSGYVSGISAGGLLPSTIVYITGNQTISGVKTFAQTGSFDTIQITNKKLSSYNYINSNFTFGDAHINIVNSSNNVIGTLPSSVTSGINYYVKNLNTGVLLITGSNQRTIDGFSNINLYKNESLQLLGVNNIGYTGWISLSVSAGVS